MNDRAILYRKQNKIPDELPEKQKKLAQGNISLAARDYISGLTDNFAINLFKEKYFLPPVFSVSPAVHQDGSCTIHKA